LDRLSLDALDPDDPFEVDELNSPHLAKHLLMSDGRPVIVTISDVRDHYAGGAVQVYEADPDRGPAHWLIVCRIDGVVVTVPILPAKSGDPTKCRPIGLFETTGEDRLAYLEDENR
jgi:hypothetical protein